MKILVRSKITWNQRSLCDNAKIILGQISRNTLWGKYDANGISSYLHATFPPLIPFRCTAIKQSLAVTTLPLGETERGGGGDRDEWNPSSQLSRVELSWQLAFALAYVACQARSDSSVPFRTTNSGPEAERASEVLLIAE